MKGGLAALATALLSACAGVPPGPDVPTAPAGASAAPVDWVCLLPDADGRVGRVAVQAGAGVPGTAVLEGAYNTARVGSDGRLRFVQTDGVFMGERYGALLSSLPPRPVRLAMAWPRLEQAESQRAAQGLIAHLAARTDAEVWLLHLPDPVAQERALRAWQMLVRLGVDATRMRLVADPDVTGRDEAPLDLLLV